MNIRRYISTLLLLFGCIILLSAEGIRYVPQDDDRNTDSSEYAYDANGNMTRDLNKGISNITYNLLNLPGEITFSDGRKVKYIYTADGAKVRTIYFDATGSKTLQVDYLGNYILRNGEVDRILTTSGYIKNDTVYSYVKDYQGNVRSVVRQDGAVVESTDYYPYGTPFTTAGAVQPYKYGAKELDRMHGLDLYDSQARWYDALLGRTSTMDPKAEKYYNLSPYTWCAGNPVRFIDPDGKVLKFAKGSSVGFKQYFFEALCYMIVNGTADNIFHIMNSKNVYQIKETSGRGKQGNRFESESSTIYWNPLQGLCTTNNNCLSPTTMLDHEAQHCVNYDKNPQKFLNDLNTKDNNYGSIGEKNVIENRETQTAIKQGEITNEKHSRDDHYGDTFITNDPTKNYQYSPMYSFFYIMWGR